MLVNGLFLNLLQIFKFHDGLPVKITQISNNIAFLSLDPLPLNGSFLPIDQKSNKSNLIENIDVIGIILVESEFDYFDQSTSHRNISELSWLIVCIYSWF